MKTKVRWWSGIKIKFDNKDLRPSGMLQNQPVREIRIAIHLKAISRFRNTFVIWSLTKIHESPFQNRLLI